MNTNSLDFELASTQYGTAATTGDGAFASSSYTIEGWVKMESFNAGGASFIVAKDEDGKRQWCFGVETANERPYAEHYGNGAEQHVLATTETGQIDAGVWDHLAISNNAGTFLFYVNGVVQSTSILANNYATQGDKDTPVTLAKRQIAASPGYFDGKIDDVRFWNVARSGANILGNMRRELVGNETNLVGYWKLNDGTGTTALDATANNFDITLINTPTWSVDVPFSEGGAVLFGM